MHPTLLTATDEQLQPLRYDQQQFWATSEPPCAADTRLQSKRFCSQQMKFNQSINQCYICRSCPPAAAVCMHAATEAQETANAHMPPPAQLHQNKQTPLLCCMAARQPFCKYLRIQPLYTTLSATSDPASLICMHGQLPKTKCGGRQHCMCLPICVSAVVWAGHTACCALPDLHQSKNLTITFPLAELYLPAPV
jgi:hypothetical protein